VLRLWRERVRVALCPDRVVAARLSRSRNRGALARAILPVTGAGHDPSWQPAVAALSEGLSKVGASEADVTAILSNHFVRYLALPWSEGLRTEEDWRAFAEHRFLKAHGPEASEWSLRLSSSDGRGPRVASAIDRRLVEAISLTLHQGGNRLASLQPYLMTSFNRLRGRLAPGSAWVITHEPGRLAMGFVVDGQWQAVRQRRVEIDWAPGLADLLDRESQLAGLPLRPDRVYVDAPEMTDELPPRLGEYRIERVPSGLAATAGDDVVFAMIS